MGARIATAGGVVAIALAVLVLAQGGAAAATTGTVSLDVTGMAYWAKADHFNSPPCAAPPVASVDRAFAGTTGSVGSFIGDLQLPQGASVRQFRLSARDNDTDNEIYAYLLRKRMAPKAGVDGFGGYQVLASVHSGGFSMLLRRFTTSSVTNGLVNDSNFSYFAEIVNCVDTTDPIGVQIVWSKP